MAKKYFYRKISADRPETETNSFSRENLRLSGPGKIEKCQVLVKSYGG